MRCPILRVIDGLAPDAVMELWLTEAELAFELLRPGGTMGVVGCHCTPQFAFSPVQAYDKNLTYRTGRCPARAYMDRLLPLLQSRTLQVDAFLTHTFSFAECVKAYDIFSKRKENCLRVAFIRSASNVVSTSFACEVSGSPNKMPPTRSRRTTLNMMTRRIVRRDVSAMQHAVDGDV
jgi:hypothetical protein